MVLISRHPALGLPMFQHVRCPAMLRRLSSSAAAGKPLYDLSLLGDPGDQKICLARQKLGFKKPPKFVVRKSSIFLYESCTDQLDLNRYFQELKLEDTFNSWFCITRWHVWMVACRCMADKLNGKDLRNELIRRMWEDVGNRMDKLTFIKRRMKYRLVQNYYAEFNATLFGMDEGMLHSDAALAGAIWRNLLGVNPESAEPARLDLMVHYTRAQLQHLSTAVSDNQLLLNGRFHWRQFAPLVDGPPPPGSTRC